MEDDPLFVAMFSLEDCVSCRACSETCPSYRNGGIDPERTISMVISNDAVTQVWTCLQCHRCTMICPQGIDIAGMMLALREIDAKRGNVPDVFRKTASAVIKDGCTSLPKGRMEVLRKDLDLPQVTADGRSVKELNSILRSAGFPHE